jgi:tetratricopeptide (TPR) repeat protein
MLKNVKTALIIFTTALIPLFFLTLTTEFYETNKQTLLYLSVATIIGISIFEYVKTKELKITISPLNLPVALFCLTSILTLLVVSPNKAESIFFPVGAGTITLLTIWYYVTSNGIEAKKVSKVLEVLTISAVILAVIAGLQILGVGANAIFKNIPWLQSKIWNPTGSPLTLALLLVSVAPYPLLMAIDKIRNSSSKSTSKKHNFEIVKYSIQLFVIILVSALLISQLNADTKPIMLPFAVGWAIAAEMVKSMVSAFIGIGQQNFLAGFTTGRSVGFNALPIWNIRFAASTNFYLQTLVELGIIGLGAYIFLILKVFSKGLIYLRGVRTKVYPYTPVFTSILCSIIIIFIEQLFFPSGFVQLFVLFTLLALAGRFLAQKTHTENSRILFYVASTLSTLMLLYSAWNVYNAYAAEVLLKQSLEAAQQNRTQDVYNLQDRAIRHNPYIDRYHSIFSQTNLALAVALSNKKELSNDEKTTLSQLLAQAAQQGKLAISQNPVNVNNWENLASVYRAMIGGVKDADLWTVQALQQAAQLDPVNPNIRLSIGGVFFVAKNYDMAITNFTQAANLKPDFANAYYNIAAAYREKKEWDKAAQAMQIVINLTKADSPDRKKAEAELEEIKKNVPQVDESIQGEQLQSADKNDKQINTQVEVPKEIAPPSPSPSPEN